MSVTDVTHYLHQLLESDEILQELWVEGEISNLSRPSSGHIYFTLKDTSASLRCVIWRATALRMHEQPRDGTRMQAHGSIGVYDAGGQYQLYVDLVRPAGEGAYYQEFMRLKAKLEDEGLFDPQRKRAIPQIPHRIGIVTSPTGAALQDMLNVLSRRFPMAEVIVAPAAVQGGDAPASIVAAIRALNRVAQPDVILVARGGGSIEDLWAFNDELVVRTIAASHAPVITGVGHETDFTLADFAADLRAPTPTAAAELCSPNREDLFVDLRGLVGSLEYDINDLVVNSRHNLEKSRSLLRSYSPLSTILSERQRVDETQHAGQVALRHRLVIENTRLAGLRQQLTSLSPQAVLERGYAIVTHVPGGELVRSVHQAAAGDTLHVRFADGGLNAQVEPPEQKV